MKLQFSKSIYTVEQTVRAAYLFTDQAYIYLDDDKNNIYVMLEAKESLDEDKIAGELKNELLAQRIRADIEKKTGGIRELIFRRALSSSMIFSDEDIMLLEKKSESHNELDEILKDWFEKDES